MGRGPIEMSIVRRGIKKKEKIGRPLFSLIPFSFLGWRNGERIQQKKGEEKTLRERLNDSRCCIEILFLLLLHLRHVDGFIDMDIITGQRTPIVWCRRWFAFSAGWLSHSIGSKLKRGTRGELSCDDFGSNKQHTRTMGLKKLVNKWGIGRERGNE